MKTDSEHRTDLDEKIIKEPVEKLEADVRAAKSAYLNLKKQQDYEGKEKDLEEARNLLVSKSFKLASMYHVVGKDGEAHRVYGDIVHYDDSQARIIEIIRAMIPEDATEEQADDIKYRKLMALTAAAGEGAYSKADLFGE